MPVFCPQGERYLHSCPVPEPRRAGAFILHVFLLFLSNVHDLGKDVVIRSCMKIDDICVRQMMLETGNEALKSSGIKRKSGAETTRVR